MPVRLILYLLALLAGALYVAFLNPQPISVAYLPGLKIEVTLAEIMTATFALGALSMFFLYFYDTFAGTLRSWRRSISERRKEKVATLYQSAHERLVLGRRKEARKLLRKAQKIDHHHTPTIILLGTMAREDGAVSEAITSHARARGLDPANVEARLELAADYVAAEQFANAVATLNEAREIAGASYPLLVRIRDIFVAVKNWPLALEVQRQALDLAPREAEDNERKKMAAYHYEDGLQAMQSEKIPEARERFRETLRYDTGFTPAYLKLAMTEDLLGWEQDAVKTLEKGFRATRSLVILKFIEGWYVSRGKAERAVAQLRWARDVAPEEPLIRLFLAAAALAQGDHDAARSEVDRVDSVLRATTIYHLAAGATHRAENNIDLAFDSLQAALRSELATLFIFRCDACHHTFHEYQGRCPSCGDWNTFSPALV